ncbi:uncharacterized protein LOC122070556 [Macadamia integrifolia]|uniref:uncharacterized protein LOC122070556 n=1 Tax=Macadamia integrifolia TaxID=60698 RepID=UPI001C4F7585|nr:uncharacterized protein LOC122070556 [Macadamia integrifolia]
MVESPPDELTSSRTVPPAEMSIRMYINYYNLRTALQLISHRISTPSPYLLANVSTSKHIYASSSMKHQGLQFLSLNARGIHSEPDSPMMGGKVEEDKEPHEQPPAPVPHPSPKPTFPTWVKWVLGSVLTIILPFWKQKWEKLKAIEGAMEVAVEEVEEVAEAVEKVADMAEKVSEEVANSIPEDGPLKEAALLAERVTKEVAKEAHLTEEIIHTVEVLKEEVESLIDPLGTKRKDAHGQK